MHSYFKLSDPNNQFIKQITIGGDKGLQELQRKEVWRSISEKYEKAKDSNEFLNSLSEDEFTEYIS